MTPLSSPRLGPTGDSGHRTTFEATGEALTLPGVATHDGLLTHMESYVLGSAPLTGTYQTIVP